MNGLLGMADVPADISVEAFKAWVWTPPYWSWRVRGVSNATLGVYPGGFTVSSRFARGGWPESDYRWPAVVIQTLRPFGGPSVLFDINGALASCAVRRFDGARLRSALESADLMIIDVSRLGWEAPHRVTRAALGEHADEVPSSVVE